ncbi:MAG: SDR family oxidoreductase [Polyangiales bacterium]
MSLLTWAAGPISVRTGSSGFGIASTAEEVTRGVDMSGKVVLITGVNSGLGAETARVMAMRGARIVGLARTQEKADAAVSAYDNAIGVACELSEPSSVRQAVKDVIATDVFIDALITNAGIMALPERTVRHGQEMQFLTNHVGHFILVTGLLERLAPKGRVVALSSLGHRMVPKGGIHFEDLSFERGYDPGRAYGQSKLANLLFARALSKRLPAGQTANSVHPGVIATNLTRHMAPILKVTTSLMSTLALKSVEQGAATQSYVAASPAVTGVTGKYFSHCNVASTSAHAKDDALAERLWTRTESIVAGFGLD